LVPVALQLAPEPAFHQLAKRGPRFGRSFFGRNQKIVR
jgi:hypothetical protein